MYPVILKIGNFTIHSYGIMMALAFITGIFIAKKNLRFLNLPADLVYDLAIYIIISSIIGARLFYVIVYIDYYLKNPLEIIKVYKGGLVYYGGFIGAIIGGILFAYINKINFFKLADTVMPALSIGQSIGRIGCFLNGCCYGKTTDCFCGVVFPILLDKTPRIPTQIISSFFNFLIFLILFIRFKKRKFNGELVSFYLVLYGIFRFIIEFFRDDPRGDIFFNFLSISQIISIVAIFLGIILYFIKYNLHPKNCK